MLRYVALLRGINVGGHRVKMDRLRALFREMGFEDVATFIASGNVIFSSPVGDDPGTLEERVAAHLGEALGYGVRTFVRTPDELERVTREAPEEEGRALYVVFLATPPGAELRARLSDAETDDDRFHVAGREIYWSIRGKLSESPLFGAGLDKVLGGEASTMRNINSLRRLVKKAADS